MQKITPFLWFDGNAEEAMNYYTSVFKDAKVGKISRMPAGGPGEEGKVLTATFTLAGQDFIALNGGPQFKFNESVSFSIDCKDQEEIDYYWDTLTKDGGEESMCGWLKDKFGLSWQVVPTMMLKIWETADKAKAERTMQAMMKMKKLIIKDLEEA